MKPYPWELVTRLAPGAYREMTSLDQGEGYPRIVVVEVHRRLGRLLARQRREGRAPLMPAEVSRLVGKLARKISRKLTAFLVELAPELGDARARRLLDLPPDAIPQGLGAPGLPPRSPIGGLDDGR